MPMQKARLGTDDANPQIGLAVREHVRPPSDDPADALDLFPSEADYEPGDFDVLAADGGDASTGNEW
jgi:hypothetical protein